MIRIFVALLAVAVAIAPAEAAGCVLDYEAFVIRAALPDDATTIEEQSAPNYDWYVSGEQLNVMDHRYGKYGLPRVVTPDEIEFYAFKDSVPLFREAKSGSGVPDVIYASTDPTACEVQPYALAR